MADLGPQLRTATSGAAAELEGSRPRWPSGLEAIDELLGGGFPADRLSEVSGAPSSGRTSLGLALLAETTNSGECVAVVDPCDAFDPRSAAAAGIALERVLWTRPRSADIASRELLRCLERLLETAGLPLVLLDLAPSSASTAHRRARPTHSRKTTLGEGTWLRLARLARSTSTALVVLSNERRTGAHAQIALEMQPARPHFEGEPALLEGLETQAVLVRHRSAPSGRSVRITLDTRAA